MSVNEAWQGRRFKTLLYKRYEREVLLLLPAFIDIPDGDLAVHFEFGVSNNSSDIDNPVKPFLDILAKKYAFNDNRVFFMSLQKTRVNKANVFVRFKIMPLIC